MPILPLALLLTAGLLAQAAPPDSLTPHGSPGAGGPRRVMRATLPDEGVLTFEPAPGPARIPFDLRSNHIYFRGRVNDSDSLWFVLDSGAGANVVEEGVAKRLGLEVAERLPARGAGGVVMAGRIPNAKVSAPGATLAGSPIIAMPLDAFLRQSGRPMEAILGYPLFQRCVVRIDYAGRTIELHPAAAFDYRGKGVILPLTFENRHPHVTAKVTLPGREPVEGRFVIDLGSSQALILSPWLAREQGASEAIGKTVEARGRGVGGTVPARMGRAERLELGGFRFERPLTVLPDDGSTPLNAPGLYGNIGGDILQRFTVIFDYSRQRMILEPNARLADPFEGDMSGIGPRMGPDGSRALEVEWIQADSPAGEAGLKPDDLIESIDGRPALEVGVPGLKEMFRRPGNTHRLGIRRGGERLEIAITTRRLI